MKLTKFLNTCAAAGGQAGNDCPEMELSARKKALATSSEKFLSYRQSNLLSIDLTFIEKLYFKKNTENFRKFRNTKDIHFATMKKLLINYS